jgi:hypothetical protein
MERLRDFFLAALAIGVVRIGADARPNRKKQPQPGVAGRGAVADLTDIQRAVLRMLAKSTRGYALSTVMARGFTFDMLQELVRLGLAAAYRDAVAWSKTKVAHLRITEVGRKAVAE